MPTGYTGSAKGEANGKESGVSRFDEVPGQDLRSVIPIQIYPSRY